MTIVACLLTGTLKIGQLYPSLSSTSTILTFTKAALLFLRSRPRRPHAFPIKGLCIITLMVVAQNTRSQISSEGGFQ